MEEEDVPNNAEERISNIPSRLLWRTSTRERPQSFLFRNQYCVQIVGARDPKTPMLLSVVMAAEDRVSRSHYDRLLLEWSNKCNKHAQTAVVLVR